MKTTQLGHLYQILTDKSKEKSTCDLDVDIRLMHPLRGAVKGDRPPHRQQVHPVLRGVIRREQGLPVLLESLEALSLVPLAPRRRHWFLNEHLIGVDEGDYIDNDNVFHLLLSVTLPVLLLLLLQLLVATRESVGGFEGFVSVCRSRLFDVFPNPQRESRPFHLDRKQSNSLRC